MLVYKIVPQQLWTEALERGVFAGAPVDHADGFIHLSTAQQVVETARRHFRDQTDLLLVTIDDQDFGAALVYEPSRGGDLFPHLYGPLPVDRVRRVVALPIAEDGTHRFEGLLP